MNNVNNYLYCSIIGSDYALIWNFNCVTYVYYWK